MALLKQFFKLFSDDSKVLNQLEDSFTLNDKVEFDLVLSTAESKIIDTTLIDTLKIIQISSDDDFQLTMLHNANTIIFDGTLFILKPSATFLASLTTLTVSSDNAGDITVSIRLYGKV